VTIKKFHLFESEEVIDDIQIIKDIFQSFEEDHNSLSSEYIVMMPNRKVLQYVNDGLEDGLDKLTSLEFRQYYTGHIDKNIFKVKIVVPIKSYNLTSVISDSLTYLDRIESEGFYCNNLITSRIGSSGNRRSVTYYDILVKSSEYVGFINDRVDPVLTFYFYFSRV